MKSVFHKIFIVVMSVMFASVVSNANPVNGTGSIQLKSAGKDDTKVNLSKNVHAKYASDNGSAYTASTYNDKGSQTYLSGSWTTYIYYADQKAFPTTFSGNSGDKPSNSATWKVIGD